jgi:RND family efflux transporter MFP subunit
MQILRFALTFAALQRNPFMIFTRVIAPLCILALGGGAWYYLGRPVEKPKPMSLPEQLIKTEVLELQPRDYQVLIESQGTVRAHYVTTITPLVSGTVTVLHPSFEDGAFFEKDEVLAELDPADFEAALASAEARLARAEAALSQEQARAKQARLNWNDIGYDEEPSELVLRVPQLKEAEASVKAATADLDQAKRNLERTKIKAPFEGRVKARLIGLGQAVGGSTPLGEVFASDYAEIRLPISPSQLSFVRLPIDEADTPVPVTLTDASGAANADSWQANIVRTEGTLDDATRELFVIARIEDPFGRDKKSPSLRIGQPLRGQIQGLLMENVYVLPRKALRGVNRVYMIEENPPLLMRRSILPVWSTATELVVSDGFTPGEKLSISSLAYAVDGARVEVIPTAVEAVSEEQTAVPAPKS